jgi:hypothetical protein
MHYGRFCRETGRWIKVEADQASPVLPESNAADVMTAPNLAHTEAPPADNLVPLGEAAGSGAPR